MASKTGTARTTRRRLRSTDEPDPPEPVALSDALPRLASALDEAAEAAGWGGRPSLVRVTAWPSRPVREGFDLGIRPLEDDRSVVEALSGFCAPSEWMAIGVVTEGTARHLVDTTSERRRVRCVHLVDRTRIHDLSHEILHAYAASDARLARVLTERRWPTAVRFVDRFDRVA